MAKNHKIKRSKKTGLMTYKARPHPLTIILFIAAAAGLVFLGMSLFGPVSDFIMSFGSDYIGESSPEESELESEESATESEPEKSQPEPEPPKTAPAVKAAYMPLDIALDSVAAAAFLDNLPAGTDSVMVDIKNSQGQVLFATVNEKAAEWGAVPDRTYDLKSLAEMALARKINIVARMDTFSDPIAARGDRIPNAIKYQNSEMLWLDNYADRGGKPWLNPYSPEARGYLKDIAAEAAEYGAVMIVMDTMRFPDDMTGSATFGGMENETSRAQALTSFTVEMGKALEPFGAKAALYIPAAAVTQFQRDARYGGNPLALAENIVLGILPEQLETGYLAEGVIVTRPATDIAATVRETLAYVKSQSPVGKINIIPMLGAERSGTFAMTADNLTAQISAASDSGSAEYILYAASGQYPPG